MENLFSVAGKVAVVTGGSRGIGLMIARGLVESGVRVYISSRKADACDAAAAGLNAGGECISIPADLSTVEGAAHLADAVGEREKAVQILVNNAGAVWGAELDEYPEAGWDRVIDTNLKGVFFVTQKLLPLLRRAASQADPARIINIGSIDGLLPPAYPTYAYSTSKAGLHMLTRHIATDLASENILVNAIAPGLFPSRMTAFALATPELEAETTAAIPLRRAGTWEDIVGTTLFLASRAGAYVTGAVIPVSGGLATLRG